MANIRVPFNLVNGANTGDINYIISQSTTNGVTLVQDGVFSSNQYCYTQSIMGSYITFNNNNTEDSELITTGDFTIELWFKEKIEGNSFPSDQFQDIGFGGLGFGENFGFVGNWNTMFHDDSYAGASWSWNVSAYKQSEKYNFYTISRKNNKYYFTVNGNIIDTGGYPDHDSKYNFNTFSLFYGDECAYMKDCRIDGLKIIVGKGIYTANFTPPKSYDDITYFDAKKKYLKQY